MIFFILGILFAMVVSLNYKRKLINFILFVLLFLLVTLFLNKASFFKSLYSDMYALTVFFAVLFLHVFFVLGYPLMVKFSLRHYPEYISVATKIFLSFGFITTFFALYMFFIKGVIYD
ncbi:hypothetical protein HYE66_02490 [Aggregatibacter actinomycetemcomitans]|nr:hypothetical protein [Aggregatibacter actinomycetemcomitans]